MAVNYVKQFLDDRYKIGPVSPPCYQEYKASNCDLSGLVKGEISKKNHQFSRAVEVVEMRKVCH